MCDTYRCCPTFKTLIFYFYFALFFFLFASLSYCKMAHNSTIRVSLKLQVSHSFDSQNDLPHIYCDFCFASIFLKAFFWSSKEKRTKQHKTATRTGERYLKLAIQESCSHWITKCSNLQELKFPNMEKEVKQTNAMKAGESLSETCRLRITLIIKLYALYIA